MPGKKKQAKKKGAKSNAAKSGKGQMKDTRIGSSDVRGRLPEFDRKFTVPPMLEFPSHPLGRSDSCVVEWAKRDSR